MASNSHSDDLPAIDPVFLLHRVDDLQPSDPLGTFLSRQHNPEYSRPAMLSPLCIAAMEGDSEKIIDIYNSYQDYLQGELDRALLLANSQGHTEIANTLESYHADPGRNFFANGLHGAAWSGNDCNIQRYIESSGAKADVTDGSSATPIIYAIFGIQIEEYAWATIQFLLGKGASAWTKFGSEGFSYEEIAQKEGKMYLAQKFRELGPCPSPTIQNSSREPSYTPGEDNYQANELQNGLEADEEVSLSRESSCTVGRDDIDNEQDPEIDGGAGLSCESSCTVGRDDDIQPNNKRPRADSETNGGAKRAREV
ncbi:hypothetical protein F25303_13236 [Fusarium sp. NRRL 25303]|nr:hypothetical protein F25303_13236 [Fusarium sp. NRRL 25303]